MLKVYNVMISYLYTLWHDYWNQLQYPCLENLTDGGAWKAVAHEITKSRTWLSDFPFTFHFNALEKEMATHSSVLAWRIPGMGEPGGLLSMGLHRVGHDWSNIAAAAAANTFINSHTLIFLFACITESDVTERLNNNRNLLTIVITLYITSTQLIHLVLKACTCWPAFPISLHPKYLSIYIYVALCIYLPVYLSTFLSWLSQNWSDEKHLTSV